ncbi:MAG: hypothetical protein PHH13_02385 [Candidatus Peribacteraceae bacterium]|nr:hypothetical protein [Candidatus Peribacteraceae bacterium]
MRSELLHTFGWMFSDSLFREARMLREVPAEGPKNAAEKAEADDIMDRYRKHSTEARRVEKRLDDLRSAHPDDPELGRERVKGEARRLASERSFSRNFSHLGYPENLTDKYVTNMARIHNITFGLRGTSLIVTRGTLDEVNGALDDMQALTIEFKKRGVQRVESAYGAVTPLNRGQRTIVTIDEHNRQYVERVKEAELGDMVIKALTDCRDHFTKYDGANFRNSVSDPTWIADNPERYREVAMQALKQDPENIKYFDRTVFPKADINRLITQQLSRDSGFILRVPDEWRTENADDYKVAVLRYAMQTGDPAILDALHPRDWPSDDRALDSVIEAIVAKDPSLVDQLATRCKFYVDQKRGMGHVLRELLTKDAVVKNENILDMVIGKRMTFEGIDGGYGDAFEDALKRIYERQPAAAVRYLMFFPQERLSEKGDEEIRQFFEKIAMANPTIMQRYIVDHDPGKVLRKFPALLRFAPVDLQGRFVVTRELAKTSPWILFNLNDTLKNTIENPTADKEKDNRDDYRQLVLKAFDGANASTDFETMCGLFENQAVYLKRELPNVWREIRTKVWDKAVQKWNTPAQTKAMGGLYRKHSL